ncbi:unnamed protein product [Parnassius mnemosyne]|uniref:C2H2-type domain-containing protein n=2 Tax=Parnassius mnemosyne TaxID=213953 RepID=A0AAV1MCY0_9NEOP
MATKLESEYPHSPTNDESEEEEEDEEKEEEEEEKKNPVNNDFANILKKLESVGALLKKPKKEEEYRCFTCNKDFSNWDSLENHLIQHVSLPSVVLDKLPSDEEDTAPSGDENWSDEDVPQPPQKSDPKKAPQKVDISQILKKTGLSIKKKGDTDKSSDAALNKLSGLGFTIRKNSTPIKKEKNDEPEQQNESDLMKKLGKLGGIKLKLKSDGNNTNTFKVINGLKDFKASDDEDEGSENEDSKNDEDSSEEIKHKNEEEDCNQESDEEQCVNNSRRSSENSESGGSNRGNQIKNIKTEPIATPKRVGPASKTSNECSSKSTKEPPAKTSVNDNQVKAKESSKTTALETPAKPSRRPSVKQTPKRGTNNAQPLKTQDQPQAIKKDSSPAKEVQTATPERRESNNDINLENVVVKKEVPEPVSSESQSLSTPLFSAQIKSERSSPIPPDRAVTPVIARVKTEPDVPATTSSQPIFSSSNVTSAPVTPLLPVTKTEDTSMTIIEINGDSNDEDDDCCVVSSTPAPDVKPVIPKTENPSQPPPPAYPTPMSYPTSAQSSYNTAPSLSSRLSATPSTEKQHNFNWNAPDSKPPIDMLEKSADEIFESLLSSSTKKENMSSLSDASEYISLDTLGPQHSCEVCNTRFTDISLLEEHRRISGHSNSLMNASSSTLMPYNPTSNILSSLLPVKQLAEQVGKLSTIGSSSSGFTHQQNVMINIQAYPGGGGVMVPPQPYNAYASPQAGYPQSPNNMYSSPGQTMPGQYPGSNYAQSNYGQYPSPMSKAGYPGAMPQNIYSNAPSPYSTASPLQSMQQSVYGQTTPGLHNQHTVMGPPGSSPSQGYASAPSPSSKQSPSNIRIQNVQTFPPGQIVGGSAQSMNNQTMGQVMGSNQQHMHGQEMSSGQTVPGQITAPTQIRMAAGANVTGSRPRMPNIRGTRPSIRPGIQVHGQVRGAVKQGPRMPLKRPGTIVGGPVQKRRPDMLLPGKHDNEDCQVMAMQKQRDGLPMIQSVQGAKDKLNLGSQISITKKTVNKEANAMANVLASRGISVKQKQKSRSPSPQRPLPNIPNLGAGVSIKHSSKSSNFSIPEAKVGGGMMACKICKKMFMNSTSLSVHMTNAHPQSKIPVFKCDECPASYPKSLQLQHHKRVFHNVSGPNRELGLPVVDLSQEDNLKRLSSLGIYSFIPLANREQANGCFGIPVISVHNVQNGMTSSLQALGADGLLSLGPLKPLPNS